MSNPIVSVRNLRKTYRVYSHPAQMIREVFTGRMHHREFVALDDISFDVRPGSVVGLLGRNGAGKSTLLRIVARTLDATGGSVSTVGRISAILELGTGFHLDYTGRENIYFGGICLGMSRREMHERVDEIIAFSELEDFIDQPFRTYSSGMQARLTFSVATCVDPDILIVDEALAVGDAKFQLKSFDRIREFKRRGKAILLVSHSINQIAAFCDYAILLDHGRMLAEGDPNRVCNIYHELLFGPEQQTMTAGGLAMTEPEALALEPASNEPNRTEPVTGPLELNCNDGTASGAALSNRTANGSVDGNASVAPALRFPIDPAPISQQPSAWINSSSAPREHRYGNGAAKIVSAEIQDLQGRVRSRLRSLDTYEIHLKIIVYHAIPNLSYGILLRDARGIDVFGGTSEHLSHLHFGPQEPGAEINAMVRFRANLPGGIYFLTLGLANIDQTKYDMRFDAIELTVEPTPGIFHSSVSNIEAQFELVETHPRLGSPMPIPAQRGASSAP